MRQVINFDGGWKFRIGDENLPETMLKMPIYYEAKTEGRLRGFAWRGYGKNKEYEYDGWENVTLPHDFIISQEPTPDHNNTLGYFKYDNAWYRKHFRLDESDRDKRISILFEGVATHATVYVNGCLMAHNFCGYTSFEVDITDVARFGADENVVAVYVNTTEKHEGWWYSGGGIYRHVHLIKTALVSVDLWGIFVHPEKSGDSWHVPVDITLRNDDEFPRDVQITAELRDSDGVIAEMSGMAHVEQKYKKELNLSADVVSPKLWDCDAPNLYECVVHVYEGETEIDTCTVKFGFRTLTFDPDHGFFLNGKQTKIKGVCCHEDYGLQGKAVSDSVKLLRLERLREMGANGYRMAHYPHSAQTFDYCAELGYLVMAETRWFASTEEGLSQMDMMIRAHRNNPAVIMWSLGNEEPLHAQPIGRRIFITMREAARRLDPTRPLTTAVSNDPARANVMDAVDIIGVNYNFESGSYDILHEKYPDKMIYSSECCAVGSSRGWYYDDCDSRGYIGAHDHGVMGFNFTRENTWKYIMEREWLAGGYQWAGIEHRGETVWPRLCSQSGALDLFLQKKDAFYQNKSHFTDEPMVHILPHWNHDGREGEILNVWVYTNCDEVALMFDGAEIGRAKVEKYGHAEFPVEYRPGRLECTGYRNGEAAAYELVETTGCGVKLELELQNKHSLKKGDAAVFNCYVLDADGRRVPDAEPFVRFECNGGRIVGTGSDICDHTPVPSLDRRMRAGIVSACVIADGDLRVYARAEGLRAARIEVPVK